MVKKGLNNSEHISKIIIHPNNSDVLWVASQVLFGAKVVTEGLQDDRWR